jgi:hypothetical protein
MEIGGSGSDVQRLTRRLRVEATLTVLTATTALLTIAWSEWIEAVFRIDPDGGSGAVEWAFVAVLALCSLTFALLAQGDRAARARFAGRERLAHR